MPQFPMVAWLVIAAVALLLCALCATTIYAVLRRSWRSRVEQWPVSRVLVVLAAASVPWLVVWLAPITIEMNIRGMLQRSGWILAALACFALLVLLPLAALTSGAVWCAARRRRNG
jgi:hypothetical protein